MTVTNVTPGLLLALSMATWLPVASAKQDVQGAIVKIYTVYNKPDHYNPWSMAGPRSATGSGCIIDHRRILTNAHVVSDQTFIQVRRYGDPRRFEAKVLYVSHEADLALLTVDDPAFFKGVTPLKIGKLPEAQQEILVYGFPMGGDTLSTTKGVVSRVEHQIYTHSSRFLIAAQIDAAINPGNSGGPVIAGGLVLGVVMQGLEKAENIGYLVPAPIIMHFLEDVADGRHDGVPSLGVWWWQRMENPALKRSHLMETRRTGVLVNIVIPGSAAHGHVKTGDVLLGIDGHQIGDDGTIEFRPGERTPFFYYVQLRQIGESIELEVLRRGKPKKLKVVLSHGWQEDLLVPLERYDRQLTYYIYGGLVFCPLTVDYLKTWGAKWRQEAPSYLTARLRFNCPSRENEETVLVSKVLAADVNQGYHQLSFWVVTAVNGKMINNLKELVCAVEAVKDPFVIFTGDFGFEAVLDREKVSQSQNRILKTYHIQKDRSDDLVCN